ncbi:hypothetical protein BU14_0382s0011 [Porphyra umbilicalis]|uniref:Uncharacterized protein n=1 Tax=Porphyra umbilicalis TaxID=2786 RepID=A0A1X6NWY8_PORUM|nr:hypothetical protein BU14_0382s0011 [Porphyra umbilicalis]|eukprot:OSX73050.1 hypothetical protein BU14_0382s0011 [Porphyra umbilicalis]
MRAADALQASCAERLTSRSALADSKFDGMYCLRNTE